MHEAALKAGARYWESKKFGYGSKLINIVADKKRKGSPGAAGYDDEGVANREWDLVNDGA